LQRFILFYIILFYFIAGRPHNAAMHAAIVYCSMHCDFTCVDGLNVKPLMRCTYS